MFQSEMGRIIQSPNCEVEMAGFTANTYTLQQCGWEITMEQSVHMMGIRLCMRHNVWQTYAISNHVDYDFMRSFHERTQNTFRRGEYLPIFRIACLASKLIFQEQVRGPVSFQSIDALPSFTDFSTKKIDMDDMKLFKTIDHSKDILVSDMDVQELLEFIQRKQNPKQAEIRQRLRQEAARAEMREAMRPTEKIHAQIVTLVA